MSVINTTFLANNIDDTKALAIQLASLSRTAGMSEPLCITLNGEVGAGKTTFSQFFIGALTGNSEIQSPTFLIIKIYETADFPLHHMDFYRLEHEAELEELGLDEYFGHGICLIEWPDIAKNNLPDERIDIYIEHGKQPGQRKFVFAAKDDWHKRLNNIHLPL